MFPQFPLIISITTLAVQNGNDPFTCLQATAFQLPPSPKKSVTCLFTHFHTHMQALKSSQGLDPYWVSDKLVYGTRMCTYATVSEEQILSKTPEVGKSWPYFLFQILLELQVQFQGLLWNNVYCLRHWQGQGALGNYFRDSGRPLSCCCLKKLDQSQGSGGKGFFAQRTRVCVCVCMCMQDKWFQACSPWHQGV